MFCPSDNVWRSRHADVPQWAHFHINFTPSWITQLILLEKCAHRGTSACRERQTMFKIVTWTKQTWIIHQCTTSAFRPRWVISMVNWASTKKQDSEAPAITSSRSLWAGVPAISSTRIWEAGAPAITCTRAQSAGAPVTISTRKIELLVCRSLKHCQS